MAKIMTMAEFVQEFNSKLDNSYMGKLMAMAPGENQVIAFGSTHIDDVVFVRVTKHHMATMSVFEFNGISK